MAAAVWGLYSSHSDSLHLMDAAGAAHVCYFQSSLWNVKCSNLDLRAMPVQCRGRTVGRVRSHSLISSEVRLLPLIRRAAVFGSFLVWNENFKRPRALSGSSAYKDDCRSNNPLVELWIFLSISFKNMMLYDFSTGICRRGALMSSAVVTLMRVR